MRVLALALLLAGCGASTTTTEDEPPPSEPTPVVEAPTQDEDAAVDEELDILPARCHVSCCSEEMLQRQREAAVEMNDPSVEHECCFCDDDAE